MTATIAEPIRGMFRKARDVMKNGNAQVRLNTATAEVQRLEAERQRIIEEIATRFNTARFDEVADKARARFETEKSIDSEVHMVLMQLVAKEVESRVAPMRFARMRASLSGGSGEGWATFENRHPQWRVTLHKACHARLEMAQGEYQKIFAEVQAQLGSEFSSEDLAGDVRVRKARRLMERWSGAPQRVMEEKDGERLWASLIGRFCQEHE
jgi:hypothetical protein